MISNSKAAETYNVINSFGNNVAVRGTVKIYVHDKDGNDVGVMDLFDGVQIGRGIDGDSFLNKSLNTAKEIFSKLAAGNVDYKIAKIAFGNAGHNSTNPKVAVDPLAEDTTLQSLVAIMDSLDNTAESTWFLRDENGANHRMVYIEKDILPENISYGEDGNQFIVRVPISYDEFNLREGTDQEDVLAKYVDSLIEYKFIKNGTVYHVGNINEADGSPVYDITEVNMTDDGNGNNRFLFKNGLNPDGSINTSEGGFRPQEISEILLTTDIIDDGVNPPKKLGASRMTSGLLSFPEGFQFTYEWTLTWNFS
jgi:hypothetical protein